MFNHPLEHMPDQQAALRDAALLIGPQGVVVARIPTVSSYAWRHYQSDWVQLDAPRHFFLHSRESIAEAAAKAGLKVFDVMYDSGEFQFWGSEQCRQGIPLVSDRSYARHRDQAPFTAADINRFRARARELNASGDGDQAAFFMRKNNG